MSSGENGKKKTARKKAAKTSGSGIKKTAKKTANESADRKSGGNKSGGNSSSVKKAAKKRSGKTSPQGVKKGTSGSAKKLVTKKGPRKKAATKKPAVRRVYAVKGGDKKGEKKTGAMGTGKPSATSRPSDKDIPDPAGKTIKPGPQNGGTSAKGARGADHKDVRKDALVVNLAQIIQLFDVTAQAFNKWKGKETFPQEAVLGYNKFDLMAVFTWYREDIIGGKDLKQRKHMASVEKIEAEERRISYDGRSKFIKALIDENRVVETRKVVRDVGEIVATLASDLEGAKKRLPSIFANKSEKELMLLADTEIDSIKIRLHSSSMKLAGKYGAEERKN